MSTHKTILQQLLDPANLPLYFNTNPNATAGITLLYSGTNGVVNIESGVLTTTISGGSGVPLTYNLNQYTLSSLVTAINTNAGYTATVTGTGGTSALALIEVQSADIVTSAQNLLVFTTLVYQLFTVMAKAINQVLSLIEGGINEQFIFQADNKWVDYWAELYGSQVRPTGLNDATFSEDIIAEVERNRLSARDIANTILQEFLIQISIFDHQHDVVKISGVSFVGEQIIGDRAHALNQFEVFGIGVDVSNNSQVKNVITQNRAAGINPVYSYSSPNINGDFIMPFMIDLFPISPPILTAVQQQINSIASNNWEFWIKRQLPAYVGAIIENRVSK